MRSYRFGDPSKTSFYSKYSGFIYAFIGWNFVGIGLYKFAIHRKGQEDPGIHDKTTNEKLLALYGGNKDGVRTYKLKIGLDGVKVEEKKKSEETS